MSIERKQKRLQAKTAKKPSGTKAVKSLITNNKAQAEYKKQMGLSLKESGQYAQAVPFLRQAVELDNSMADVHFSLAMLAEMKPELSIQMDEINNSIKDKKALLHSYEVIMMILRKKQQYKEAVVCQDQICRLYPNDALAMMDLGLLLNRIGKTEQATIFMSKALNLDPSNKLIKGTYSSSIFSNTFATFYPDVKQAISECFKNIYDVELQRISQPWINLMMVDPSFEILGNARIIADDNTFKVWADTLNEKTGSLLNDPYFTEGLRLLIVADYLFENFLVRLRRYICLNLDELESSHRISIFEKFLYALAEQCFFNEYIYAENKEETKKIDSLTGRNDKIAIALIGCYKPLYKVMPDKTALLHDLADSDADFAKLVKTQFDDPLEEMSLKSTLPSFGEFANEISRAVQSQYEENPYPRWITMYSTPLPTDNIAFDESSRRLPYKILVAGCGTGRHAISAATRHPNAKITAIDLSRSSLAYGLRKAKEMGLDDRINFVHADILSMKDWPDQFDIIECSGVLHHMEDPFLGWKTLNEKLKLNGCFKIGLYSESARRPVVQAREVIAKNNYPSTVEGIRACRDYIISLPADDPMRHYLICSRDFYTTSLIRDFIFHVQEHRMTLKQIKDMIANLGLTCIKFTPPDPDTAIRYDKMFPDDPLRASIDNWDVYEQKYPLTFTGMYQFWSQKT